MRRIALALASLVLAIPMAGSVPARAEPPRPLLWKVSDADTTLYLLGSFHLLKKTDYPLSADVDRAFADAERVVFEVPPEELADPTVPMRMLQRAVQPGNAALADVAPPPVLEKARARLASLGLPAAQFERLEPWMVSVTMVTSLAQTMGFAPEEGLDRHLMARAKTAGKPTAGLESLDSQLDALDRTPVSEQLASLSDALEDRQSMEARLDELHGAWREADLSALERLAGAEMREKTPQTYRLLNVDRNRAWMKQLDAMLARGPGEDVLVVVGALHLLGDDGVVEQLRGRGHRVERICSACAPARKGRVAR
jgi:uncharacterized protein